MRGLSLNRVIGALSCVAVLAWSARYVSLAGVGTGELARFAGYWLLAVLLPGWLVSRALNGPRRTWLGMVGISACTGLALEIAAWMVYSLLGLQQWLWTWPFFALLVLVHPAVRRRLLMRASVSFPWWGSLTLAVSVAILIRSLARTFIARNPMPGTSAAIYPDLLWHLGLIEEAKRSFPLGTPQVIGAGDLHYHFFVDAHVAVASLISGVPSAVLLLKMWMIPFVLLTMALAAAFAEWLSHSVSAAVIAGVLATAGASPLVFVHVVGAVGPYVWNSPSQIYALPLIIGVSWQVCRLVQRYQRPEGTSAEGTSAGGTSAGGTAWADWALLAVLSFGVLGAKSSVTPTLLGGAALMWLVAVVRRRSRRLWKPLTAVAIGAVVLTYVAQKLAAGGDAGAGLQLLSELRATPLYRTIVSTAPSPDSLILPGVFGHGATVTSALLIGDLLRLLVVVGAVVAAALLRQTRRDLRIWFLIGCCLASLAAFWLIQHRGLSQYYFVLGVLPLGGVLWAVVFGRLIRTNRATAVIGGVALGVSLIVSLVADTWVIKHPIHGRAQMLDAARDLLVWTAGCAVLVGLVTGGVWLVSRRRHWAVAVAVVPVAACIGLLLASVPREIAAPPVVKASVGTVAHDRAEAAEWIEANTAPDTVFATNRQCLGEVQRPVCRSRSWWISGLGGRRVLIEGWSYTPASANNDPFDDEALLRANQGAFETGDPRDLALLASKGVQYLVVDKTATVVSDRLWQETDLVYQNPSIAIVKLRD